MRDEKDLKNTKVVQAANAMSYAVKPPKRKGPEGGEKPPPPPEVPSNAVQETSKHHKKPKPSDQEASAPQASQAHPSEEQHDGVKHVTTNVTLEVGKTTRSVVSLVEIFEK